MAFTRTSADQLMDQSSAMADALVEADALLDELAGLGRYGSDTAPLHREADRLRLTLALMRARRWGFEDGVFVHAARVGFVLPHEGGRPGERPGTDRPS